MVEVMSGDCMFRIYPSRTLDVLTIASDEGFEKTVMVVGGDRWETPEVDWNIFWLGLFDAISRARARDNLTVIADGVV